MRRITAALMGLMEAALPEMQIISLPRDKREARPSVFDAPALTICDLGEDGVEISIHADEGDDIDGLTRRAFCALSSDGFPLAAPVPGGLSETAHLKFSGCVPILDASDFRIGERIRMAVRIQQAARAA